MKMSVWPWMSELCWRSSVTVAGCFQLAHVSSDFLLKFPHSLMQTAAVPCGVWARPSSQNAAQSNLAIRLSVCPSVGMPVQTRGEAGYCWWLHSAVTVQADGNFAPWLIRCLAISRCEEDHLVGFSIVSTSQVTEAVGQEVGNEFVCVSSTGVRLT